MSLGTILVVILVIALVGGLVPWGGPVAAPGDPRPLYHGYGFGPAGGGILGLVLVVLLILFLLGRI